jgi:hypothetical protein
VRTILTAIPACQPVTDSGGPPSLAPAADSFSPLLPKILERFQFLSNPANNPKISDVGRLYRPSHCTTRLNIMNFIFHLPYGPVRDNLVISGVVGRPLAEDRAGDASTAMELDLYGAAERAGYKMMGIGKMMLEAASKAQVLQACGAGSV